MKKIFLLSIALMLTTSLVFAQHTVSLIGFSSDTSITRMRYRKENSFRWSEINPDKFVNVVRNNDRFEIKLDIQNPQIVYIVPPGYSRTQMVYVTPGDSMSFQIVPAPKKNQYEIVFLGKNAANYNYSLYMRKAFADTHFPKVSKGMDLKKYKQSLLNYKKMQLDSLDKYIQNNSVSKGFIEFAEAEIKNEYVYHLFYPVQDKAVSLTELPLAYLLDAKPQKNEVSHACKEALSYKYIYYYTSDPVANFDSVYTNIMSNFLGKDRAFLLSAMIGYYALQQDMSYQTMLLKSIQEAPKYVHDAEYLNYIKRAEVYYTMINHPFPDSVLNNTFVRAYGEDKKITLKEMLMRYEGKALYLDFWASWCTACRHDIANAHQAKEYLTQKNVAYIYLSRDTDEQAWLAAAKQDSITQNQ